MATRDPILHGDPGHLAKLSVCPHVSTMSYELLSTAGGSREMVGAQNLQVERGEYQGDGRQVVGEVLCATMYDRKPRIEALTNEGGARSVPDASRIVSSDDLANHGSSWYAPAFAVASINF